MPIVEVSMGPGRSAEQVRTLITELTEAVVRSIGVRKETVRVLIREVPTTHWAAGDVTMAETWAARAAGRAS